MMSKAFGVLLCRIEHSCRWKECFQFDEKNVFWFLFFARFILRNATAQMSNALNRFSLFRRSICFWAQCRRQWIAVVFASSFSLYFSASLSLRSFFFSSSCLCSSFFCSPEKCFLRVFYSFTFSTSFYVAHSLTKCVQNERISRFLHFRLRVVSTLVQTLWV